MAWIMGLAMSIPIIALALDYFYFTSDHGFYVIFGVWIYIYLFGRYNKRMLDDINKKYPKDENSN